MDERIEVARLVVNFGLNGNGQVIGVTHLSSPAKKLFVIPGKLAIIEVTHSSTGAVLVTEAALGPFGWEYELKKA